LVPNPSAIGPRGLNRNPSYTLGLSGGYHWTERFSTQLNYEHFFGTGTAIDGNLVEGEAIYGIPTKYVTPFLSAGVGYLHSDFPSPFSDSHDAFFLFGAGFRFKPLGPIALGFGTNYRLVLDQPDIIEPYILIGFVF